MDYEERISARSRKVGMNLSMPTSLAEVLDRIADSEAAPFHTVLTRIIRKGLAVERDERAAKHNGAK